MSEERTNTCDGGASLGFLTLRIWLSVRAILTGVEKYAGRKTSDLPVTIDGAANTYGLTSSQSDKVYGLEHYHGVPESLMTKFQDEPLLPSFALGLMDKLLGPALVLFGVTLLLGICTRTSLFVMGLLYTALTAGLILIKQDAGITWLGVHILLVTYALFHVRHNRLELFRKF